MYITEDDRFQPVPRPADTNHVSAGLSCFISTHSGQPLILSGEF